MCIFFQILLVVCFAISHRLSPGQTGPSLISHPAVRECLFVLVQCKLSSAEMCLHVKG